VGLWTSPPRKSYEEYIFNKGKFVADFEGLYRDFKDPWGQTEVFESHDTRRFLALNYCKRIRSEFKDRSQVRVLEIGCGFGHMTDALRLDGFRSVGVDISGEAVKQARSVHPESVFFQRSISEVSLLDELRPDIIIMSEVTWYILDDLKEFIDRLSKFSQNKSTNTYLIHLLNMYPPDVQKYGTDFFTDLDGILTYFNLEYLEAGYVSTLPTAEKIHKDTFLWQRYLVKNQTRSTLDGPLKYRGVDFQRGQPGSRAKPHFPSHQFRIQHYSAGSKSLVRCHHYHTRSQFDDFSPARRYVNSGPSHLLCVKDVDRGPLEKGGTKSNSKSKYRPRFPSHFNVCKIKDPCEPVPACCLGVALGLVVIIEELDFRQQPARTRMLKFQSQTVQPRLTGIR
jgi:SAM-dependent methyltransferase